MDVVKGDLRIISRYGLRWSRVVSGTEQKNNTFLSYMDVVKGD
jgi:hypothetical protein